MKDGVLKGFSRGTASGAERGSVSIKPERMGCEVALTRPHLMKATGHELGEAHKGVRCERRWVRIGWGGGESERHCRRRIARDSLLSAVYESAGGSTGGTDRVGTSWRLCEGKKSLSPSRGSVLWAISSMGRCLWIVP